MTTEEMFVRIYKALAHPVRLKIVRTLLNGPLCVCVLNESVEFSQSNLSQHLRILREAGILRSEKDRIKIIYSVGDSRVKKLLNVTEEIIKNQLLT
ncbi:MAG: ArsR/SmtB family transcription factor [Bacillota bacterium]